LGLKGPRCGSRRSEKSAEAVVPARAGKGQTDGRANRPLSLVGVMPQKFTEVELPSRGPGEAGASRRSEETLTAEEGDEDLGAQDGRGFRRSAVRPQPYEPPDADPHVRWCGRGAAVTYRRPLSRFRRMRTAVEDWPGGAYGLVAARPHLRRLGLVVTDDVEESRAVWAAAGCLDRSLAGWD